jgi:hypothetical protein
LAYDKFDKSATAYAGLLGERREAREALRNAPSLDAQAFAVALRKDLDSAPTTEHEDAARARLAGIERKLTVLEGIVDEDGNALADAITDAQEAWKSDLTVARLKAAARLEAAVDELAGALQEFGAAAAASDWIERYTPAGAKDSRARGVPDARYRPFDVTVPVSRNVINALGSTDGKLAVPAPQVVSALRAVTAPPEAPKTVTDRPATVISPLGARS